MSIQTMAPHNNMINYRDTGHYMTRRTAAILDMIAEGLSFNEIANQMELTRRHVNTIALQYREKGLLIGSTYKMKWKPRQESSVKKSKVSTSALWALAHGRKTFI